MKTVLLLALLAGTVTYPKTTVPAADALDAGETTCLLNLIPGFRGHQSDNFLETVITPDPDNAARTCTQSYVEDSVPFETWAAEQDLFDVTRFSDDGATVFYRVALDPLCVPKNMLIPVANCLSARGGVPSALVSGRFARATPSDPISMSPLVQTVTASPGQFVADIKKSKARRGGRVEYAP